MFAGTYLALHCLVIVARMGGDVGQEVGADDAIPPTTEPPEAVLNTRPSRRERWKRRLRRTGIVLLALFLLMTAFSLIYNLATAGRASLPSGLMYVRTGDIQTRYRTWGDPASPGPPIVLVHGGFESADVWDPLASLLGRGHRVEAYDQRGAGYTERRSPYTVAALADQLDAFLTARNLNRPILVAHSSGAGVVARFVLDHPDRVGGIAFIDGDALNSGVPSWPGRLLLEPWRTTLLRLGVRSDRVIRFIYGHACGPGCPPLDAAGLDQWRRPLQVPGAERALWENLRIGIPGLEADQVARIAALHLPAAVVFGAEDPLFAPSGAAETARRIGAPPPTLIPGARHLPFISDPAAVAAVIEQMVRGMG
jgi:pimeloyl-ACP methyl ester carboxylesterase